MRIKLLSISALFLVAPSALYISCNEIDPSEEWDDIEYSTQSGRRATRAPEPAPGLPAPASGLINGGSTNGHCIKNTNWGDFNCSAKFSWPTTTTGECGRTDIECSAISVGCATPLCKADVISCSAAWDIPTSSITYTFHFKIITGTINVYTGDVSWTDQGNFESQGSTSISSFIVPY
ncbi:MAG: hypothetical protein IJ209_05145 [Bacteroidaceae bacterium]|nr:hypothetical protein [Bacteroidaceae bacterium]